MARRWILVALVVAAACSQGLVDLHYRFSPGSTSSFDVTISTTTESRFPGDATTSRKKVELLIEEVVKSSMASRGIVETTITPLNVSEDGIQQPKGEPVTLKLELTPTGEISAILNESRDALEESTQLFVEARPVLPGFTKQVRIGDTWSAPLQVASGPTRIDLTGIGKLEGFALTDRRRVAQILVERSGQVTSVFSVRRQVLSLQGETAQVTTAQIDVGLGQVFSSHTKSDSTFVVTRAEARSGSIRVRVVVDVRAR